MNSWRTRAWLIIRLSFSLILLWFAFKPIDWTILMNSGQNLSIGWLFVALVLITCANTLAGVRWGWIARSVGLLQGWRRYIAAYFAGGLINQGLPSTLGGDTYRAVQSARHQTVEDGPALRYGTFCVVLDRGIGLFSNILLGSFGLILGGVMFTSWASDAGWVIAISLTLGFILMGGLLRTKTIFNLLCRFLTLLRLPHGSPAVLNVFAWPNNVGQLAISLLVHLFTLGCFAACLKAYGVNVPIEAVMIGMPALTLLMMLPISISGWGLRETTLSAVLLLWDVPAAVTVLASISYGLIVALCYLPAAWFLVHNRPPTPISPT